MSALNSLPYDAAIYTAKMSSLRLSNTMLRIILENSIDLISVVSTKGILEFVSDISRTVLGHEPHELIGKSAFDFIYPEDRQNYQTLIENVLCNPHTKQSSIIRQLHADGQPRSFEVRAAYFIAPHFSGVIVFSRELTERLKAEEQLRAAQKMAAIGKLTGRVAHDFNNLLAISMGNMELLSLQIGDNRGLRRKIDAALRATERGATLTRSLLAFTRQHALLLDSVNLNMLLDELHELLRHTVPSSIDLVIIKARHLWLGQTYLGQMQNALINLVVNACDAMPTAGKLTISTKNVTFKADTPIKPAELPAGDYVELTVSDTGVGISEATMLRIFEPFFTTKSLEENSGLGLSMVYNLARQSGGTVTVESTLGQGSQFRVYVPRRK